MRRRSYTDFVEACYHPVAATDAWVRELAVAARSAFGVGWGESFTFRIERGGVEIGDVSDLGFETAWRGQHGERRLPPAVLPAYEDFDVARLTALMRPGDLRAVLDERPLLGGLVGRLDRIAALQGRESQTSGVMVVWDAGRPLAPATRGRLRKLAAHLRAGARVRAHKPLIHAVLDHDGRVHHAEPGAKDRRALQVLSRGARAIERARVMRTVETLETWHALWDGRWTLVDAFDKDGKRWLVAKENHASSSSNDALQPRERDVALGAAAGRSLKLMAYELGLPLGTVASTLSRVMQKLRVRSRAELAALLSPLLRSSLRCCARTSERGRRAREEDSRRRPRTARERKMLPPATPDLRNGRTAVPNPRRSARRPAPKLRWSSGCFVDALSPRTRALESAGPGSATARASAGRQTIQCDTAS